MLHTPKGEPAHLVGIALTVVDLMDDADRADFISRLGNKYCLDCGSEHPEQMDWYTKKMEKRWCQCTNDD